MKQIFLLLALSGALAACKDTKPLVEKPASSIDTMETSKLGTAIDAYVAVPSTQNAAAVDAAFTRMESEIAELERRTADTSGEARTEAATKEKQLRDYRDKERIRYTEAQARAKTSEIGKKAGEAADKAGEKIQQAAESVKGGVDHAIDKARKAF